jgi:hypothetical protein
MKTVVKCSNCNFIKRRSECYRVKILGVRNEAGMLEKPNWVEIKDKAFICKDCGEQAGYKRHIKKGDQHGIIPQNSIIDPQAN